MLSSLTFEIRDGDCCSRRCGGRRIRRLNMTVRHDWIFVAIATKLDNRLVLVLDPLESYTY